MGRLNKARLVLFKLSDNLIESMELLHNRSDKFLEAARLGD